MTQHGLVLDAIDHGVREEMHEVSPNALSFISKWPDCRRIAHGLDGFIDFAKKLRPKVGRRLFGSCARMLRLPVHVGMNISGIHSRSGKVCL